MINFVLNKFVKKLNSVSLSPYERLVLRKDFLARAGLGAFTHVQYPSLKSSFISITPKIKLRDKVGYEENFDIQLIEKHSGETKRQVKFVKDSKDQNNEVKILVTGQNTVLKIKLNVFNADNTDRQVVTPETFVIMLIRVF